MNPSRSRWFWWVLLASLLTACNPASAADLPYVDLSVSAPLPAAETNQERPLLVAVSAILSPEGTIESYREFAAYLSGELGRPVEIVQRRTYAEVNDLIAQGQVDLAFICTSAYLEGAARQTMALLAAPEIAGQSVYASQLIVPVESSAQGMANLRDKSFAFTDPMSLTGRIYPTYLVQQLGSQPETFFSHVSYTYSHDRAIEAVADGVVDAAAVDSLVLAYALERDPQLAARIKIIHTSEAFGIPPVVVPAGRPVVSSARLRRILLDMDTTPAGQQVLSHLGIDRFVEIDDGAYVSARRLAAETNLSP